MAAEQPRDDRLAAIKVDSPSPARSTSPTSPAPARPVVVLDAFPDLWQDKFANARMFTAFIDRANSTLAQRPTAEQFAFDLLEWAGRTPSKTKRYYQKMMDMSYILGLIDYVDYRNEAHRRLEPQAPTHTKSTDLLEYCTRAVVVRLKHGSRVLHAAVQISPFTPEQLVDHTKIEQEEANCLLRLFVNLGLLSKQGQAYNATMLAEAIVWEDIKFGRRNASLAKPATIPKVVRDKADPSHASDSSMKKFRRCPALLPDKVGKAQTFMESVVHANNFLSIEPTTDAFIEEMILWAGRGYPKSKEYYQNLLDSYYTVGLINYTSYTPNRGKTLVSKMPSNADVEVLREICIGASLERLERGWELLWTVKQLETFTTKDIAAALNTHFHDASYHIRLFVNIGLFVKEGPTYHLTPLAMGYLDGISITYEVPMSHQTFCEPKQSTDNDPNQSSEYIEGLEVFAYLSIDQP